ncbi:MAG: metalloprotease PmbA [Gammaproteobacteria bacterium]
MSKDITPTVDTAVNELVNPVSRALERAKALGATASEAGVSVETGLSSTVRLGEVETLEYHRDRGLVVTVYFGQRKGSASSADTSPQAIDETVEKACSIARHTAEDDCAGLAPAERMASELPDLDLMHPWTLSPDDMIDLATRCEASARAVDSRIDNSEGATVSSHERRRVYGNSHGLVAGYPSSYHSVSCSVIAKDDAGMQRDYWYSAARDPAELDSAEAIGQTAGERTVKRLGSQKLSTRTAPVLFVPELARGLIGHFLGAIQGGSQYRRTSFLLDAVGDKIFPSFVNLGERPHIKKGVGSTAMDSEGVATADRDLLVDGVLQGYVLSSYSARKLGLETTANAGGLHNVLVSGKAGANLETLIKEMHTGFVVTELIGQGVNPTTGDYSRGAAGFWVENGQIAYPVHEVTVAGNLKDMYTNLVTIGDDIDPHSNIRCGSILLDELTIAGN